jgi:polar amino acid transport system substrate-binding protein
VPGTKIKEAASVPYPTRPVRLVAIGAASAALLILPACGSSKSNNSSSTSSSSASAASADPSLAAMVPAAYKSKGRIDVGSDVSYAPVEYFDENEKAIGIDPDLAAALGQKLGLKFNFHNATFDGLIPAVKSKRYDIVMSAMSDTKERQASLDFVDYFNAGTSILVKKGNPENIQSLDDLCGKTIAIQRGTTQEDVAKQQQAKCPSGKKINILTFSTDTDALTQIKSGRAVADMNDFPVAAYNAKTSSGGNDFQVVGQQISAGPYGIGFRKDDTQLRDAVQAALKALIADGTYQKILQKWNVTQGSLTTAAINGGS